ncbi:hypothetical protein [Nonomuraea sp. NPDC049784]|uniref:hypothetical protein n=1 Tax=Nonomuraea sp. NPDC049784 TaxID=3154361 RepID=UPI0033DE0925
MPAFDVLITIAEQDADTPHEAAQQALDDLPALLPTIHLLTVINTGSGERVLVDLSQASPPATSTDH